MWFGFGPEEQESRELELGNESKRGKKGCNGNKRRDAKFLGRRGYIRNNYEERRRRGKKGLVVGEKRERELSPA